MWLVDARKTSLTGVQNSTQKIGSPLRGSWTMLRIVVRSTPPPLEKKLDPPLNPHVIKHILKTMVLASERRNAVKSHKFIYLSNLSAYLSGFLLIYSWIYLLFIFIFSGTMAYEDPDGGPGAIVSGEGSLYCLHPDNNFVKHFDDVSFKYIVLSLKALVNIVFS